MSKRHEHRKLARPTDELVREQETRRRFQSQRPTLNDLVASGEYSEPMSQGEYIESLQSEASQRADELAVNPYAASQASTAIAPSERPIRPVLRKGLLLGIASGVVMTVILFGSLVLLTFTDDAPGARSFHWGMLVVAGITMAFCTTISTPLWLGGMALTTWLRRRRATKARSIGSGHANM